MTDDDLTKLFAGMRQENAAAHAERRRQFEETVNRIAAENHQFFEVAMESVKQQVDSLVQKVTDLTDELHRETASLRREMRTGFAETQAMIRFSIH